MNTHWIENEVSQRLFSRSIEGNRQVHLAITCSSSLGQYLSSIRYLLLVYVSIHIHSQHPKPYKRIINELLSTETEKDTKKKEKKEDKTDKVTKTKFTIKKGDVTQDIADTLVDKKILSKGERDKFIKYLEDNDYSPYIQLGTFEVTSEMSIKELAETVTTYPGD